MDKISSIFKRKIRPLIFYDKEIIKEFLLRNNQKSVSKRLGESYRVFSKTFIEVLEELIR